MEDSQGTVAKKESKIVVSIAVGGLISFATDRISNGASTNDDAIMTTILTFEMASHLLVGQSDCSTEALTINDSTFKHIDMVRLQDLRLTRSCDIDSRRMNVEH